MKVEHFALRAPHPLRPYVRGIWKISNAAPGHQERIMPRAVVDVLFPLSGQVVRRRWTENFPGAHQCTLRGRRAKPRRHHRHRRADHASRRQPPRRDGACHPSAARTRDLRHGSGSRARARRRRPDLRATLRCRLVRRPVRHSSRVAARSPEAESADRRRRPGLGILARTPTEAHARAAAESLRYPRATRDGCCSTTSG